MRRLLVLLATSVAGVLSAPLAAADAPTLITGGGTGTFAADLDGDGDIDGSHFGLGASFSRGSVRGHFMCQMAGNADILGLPLMQVEGAVSGGSAAPGTGTALLTGNASVNLGNGTKFENVPFEVKLWSGGPGAGHLQLTVIGAFDGVPGDTKPGNGNYDLPSETVATGQISIR